MQKPSTDNSTSEEPVAEPSQTATPQAEPPSPPPTAAPTPAPTADPAPAPPGKLIPAKKSTLVLMLLLFVVGVAIILWAWNLKPFTSTLQQTDNSYVKGQSTILSSQINGYIDKVYVNDFDLVKEGQPLISISSANYNQQVVQAEAGLVQAQTNLANQQQTIEQRRADIKAAQAKIDQVKAQYELSVQQLKRLQQLVGFGAVSQAEVDTAEANVKNNQALLAQTQANVDVAVQALKTAEVAETGLQAQIKGANAQVNQAKTNKNYSVVTAPLSGRLGPVNVRLGQYVGQGTQLMYVVPRYTWVIANFKETQMDNIKVGQKAWFTVDALNKEKFTGHVKSISPATGSEYSVIKTDNATGNFTKVVQRISVRIEIDQNQKDLERLSPGMSVNTTVDTSSTPEASQ